MVMIVSKCKYRNRDKLNGNQDHKNDERPLEVVCQDVLVSQICEQELGTVYRECSCNEYELYRHWKLYKHHIVIEVLHHHCVVVWVFGHC